MDLLIRKEAAQEISQAHAWYEQRREGLGERFMLEAEHRFDQINRHPTLFPTVYQMIRKAPLRAFPYGIYYLAAGNQIIVLRVLHHRQRHPTW